MGSIAIGVVGIVLWIGLDPLAMRLDAILEQFYNGVVSAVGPHSWSTSIQELHLSRPESFRALPGGGGVAPLRLSQWQASRSACRSWRNFFWRGFLMRWLIKEDFTAVPIGTYQPFSFWITTAFFATVHGPEWPLAVVVGILFGAWFVRTKSLGNIMLAHGVTNLLLAFYCLVSGDWHFLCTAPASK